MNTSLTKGQIQFIRDLQQKEGRVSHGLFIVEGEKMVSELLGSGLDIKAIYHTQEYILPRKPICETVSQISQKELERISALKTPNKVLALVAIPNNGLVTSDKVIYCANLQDPGNAGTVARIADWFGIKDVCFSDGSVDIYSPKSVQASMGAVFRGHYHYDSGQLAILQSLKQKGYTLYGADMKGVALNQVNFTSKVVLVMGSESHGISTEIKNMLDEIITIPRNGEAESLNVGVACGIICYKLMIN